MNRVRGKDRWLFTRFYGKPETHRQQRTWELLRNNKPANSMSWLVMEDFNEILFNSEKRGGRPRSEILMINFRHSLEDCNLFNLGFKGDPFTWSNRHEAYSFTKERLDSVVANSLWIESYSSVDVESLVARSSDHKLILLSCGHLNPFSRKSQRLFRYEAC